MQNNYTIYSKLRSSAWFLMFLFLGLVSGMAQTNMTKIKDGSISGSSSVPGLGAVLELESTNKGFLMPRLTTQQRDAIAFADRTDGLMIYNITTGCFNFWTTVQETWLSICGTPPPAIIEITPVQCEAIEVHGSYEQGVELGTSNFIRVPVTVTQAGSYDAMVSSNNGYYFYAQGSFPSAGRYTIVLAGAGTPSNGYEPAANGSTVGIGDKLVINLNGKDQETCDRRIFVVKAPVDYTLACSDIRVEGQYMIGKTMEASNKLTLKVNVTATGYWNIETNTVNGYSFRGTGKFEQEGIQEIELQGTGASIAEGTNVFTLTTNAETAVACSSVSVTVQPVQYTVNCTDPVILGTYKHDLNLTVNNTVKLKINVIATGKTEIKTNTVAGMTFTSGPLVLDTLGEQEVILTGVGKPTSGGTKNFTLVATPGMEATCGFSIPVAQQDVSFSMDCNAVQVNGSYAPNFAMNATNTMVISVDVKYPGPYEITTNTVNGISFKATGTFSTTGRQNVTLTASGTGTQGGVHRYTLNGPGIIANATCTVEVQFLFRRINVLGLGTSNYQPGTAGAGNSPRAILKSATNFGPNGTFRVEEINIVNGGQVASAGVLKNFINNNDIDVIFIGFNFSSLTQTDTQIQELASVFRDFVTVKKGVLLFSDESVPKFAIEVLKAIDPASTSPTFTFLGNYINPILNTNDPLLNGPFGDIRGKSAGTDVQNAIYIKGFSSNFVSLINHPSSSSGSWLIKHKTLGAIFVADAGWASGTSTTGTQTSGPAKMASRDGNRPIPKPYGGSSTEVYNSALYANTFAWAIRYVQENTLVDKKI